MTEKTPNVKKVETGKSMDATPTTKQSVTKPKTDTQQPATTRSNVPWIIGAVVVLVGLCVLLTLGVIFLLEPVLTTAIPATPTPAAPAAQQQDEPAAQQQDEPAAQQPDAPAAGSTEPANEVPICLNFSYGSWHGDVQGSITLSDGTIIICEAPNQIRVVPAPAAQQPAAPGTPTASTPSQTDIFGTGTCYSNGASFTLVSTADSVESPGTEMNVFLAKFGGQCVVETFKPGFLYAVSATSITWNGQNIPTNTPVQGVAAAPGHWVITFSSPKPGERNDSNGLMFKSSPSVNNQEVQALGSGTCSTGNGVAYQLYADKGNIWQEGQLLSDLANYGGVCTFTTNQEAWYWSVAGTITSNGKIMPNGQCLKAPAGEWVIKYEPNNRNNGFAFHVDPTPWCNPDP